MHLLTAGTGPAILLLHAFPLDGRMWQDEVRDLAADHRVLAPDMPGFGGSEAPQGNPSLDDWARGVLALCEENGVTTAVVAGCSMGGYLAFAIHRIAPGFAAGFAFVNTRASADSQDGRRTRYEMVERARHEGTAFLQLTEPPLSPLTLVRRPQIVALARSMMADATPVGVMAAQRAMASRKDSTAQLGEIRVPTVVVYGVDDPIIPRAEAESMAAAIPNSTFVQIAGAGHLSPMEQSDEMAAAIRSVAARAYP